MADVRGLADTSVFVALETGRPIAPLPPAVSVSVITLGELELGALAAGDPIERAR